MRTHIISRIAIFPSFITNNIIYAQPYIDIVNARYVSSPDCKPASAGKNATRLDYFNISATLPFQSKDKKDAFILSPFFEKWASRVASVDVCSEYHYGIALPVSYLRSTRNSSWNILATAIVRVNDATISADSKWQFGGAILAANFRKDKNLTYKFGVYVNGEFFGVFIIPLVGIDWKINERTNLFGVLPASLTCEYKLSNHFYTGAVFRTFTNSYHDAKQIYWRVDENLLGIFLDTYINKHIVLNIEAGHSVLRKIRSGLRDKVDYNWDARDNFYFKCMLAYRLRLR